MDSIKLFTKLSVTLRKFSVILCVLILFISHYSASAQQIVFDISKNQPLYLHDDGYAGSSIFAQSLMRGNYRVSLNQLPLDKFLGANKPDLLVLTPTVFQFHNDQEVLAVRNYVQSGGNLLVFAEHENFFRSSENLNKFLDESGIKINYDKAEQSKFNHFAEQFRVRAINEFAPADSVIFFFPATLELKDSIYSKAKTADRKHLAAIAPFGAGKVGVITDFEIIWNMTSKTGYRYGQNKKFVLGMVRSLIGPGKHGRDLDHGKKKNIWFNFDCFESDFDKMISYKPLVDAFARAGYGVRFNASMTSIAQPTDDDIYIGLCACENKAEMQDILRYKRIFLVGYNKTDFWKNITSAFEGFREKGFDTKPMEDKVNSLLDYDDYQNESWQDSLEIALDIIYSHKLSYTDSIHKTKSVIRIPKTTANYPVSFNVLLNEKKYGVIVEGISEQGVYYPAPFENNITLTKGDGFSNSYPIVVSVGNKVISGVPALFRSDYPDKAFQAKAIKKVVEALTQ